MRQADATCRRGATAQPLPLLRHVAACGFCLLLLLLSCHVPCTAAQDEQDIDLTPGATGAMRMLTGFWQGTVKNDNWDFGLPDYVCAQQVILGNGTIVQIHYDSYECEGDTLGIWFGLVVSVACLPANESLASNGTTMQVRYRYLGQKVGAGVSARDDYDCALVQRSGDSMRWWDGGGGAASANGTICPTVTSSRNDVSGSESMETHELLDSGFPAPACCDDCSTWNIAPSVLSSATASPVLLPPFPGSSLPNPPPSPNVPSSPSPPPSPNVPSSPPPPLPSPPPPSPSSRPQPPPSWGTPTTTTPPPLSTIWTSQDSTVPETWWGNEMVPGSGEAGGGGGTLGQSPSMILTCLIPGVALLLLAMLHRM